MIHGDGCLDFLRVTTEQVVVEHENCFIKTCQSLSIEFIYNHALYRVFVVCGMMMWKRFGSLLTLLFVQIKLDD